MNFRESKDNKRFYNDISYLKECINSKGDKQQ